MTNRATPPFRAEHIGSFLRPPALLEARERHRRGELDAAALRAVEDEAIRGVVALQEEVGLRGVTDGEQRRTYFHIDFLEKLDGVEARGGLTAHFHTASGEEFDFAPPVLHVTGKVRHTRPIQVEDFAFLRSVTTRTPKVSIPSPTMLHFRGGRGAISAEALIRRVTERYCVTDLSIEEPELESIIRRIYLEGYEDPDVHTVGAEV